MILACPSCSTRYFADDGTIGPSGRTVRCAACAHEWYAEPQLVLADGDREKSAPLTRERVERLRRAADQPGPAPSAAARYRQQQNERMRRDRMRAAVVAWGATGAALAASATGAVAFRQDVAELWPRSASAFAAVGLDVNVYGLEFANLSVERAFEGPTPVLMVSGEVHNIGRDAKEAPPVRITLRDGHSNNLFEVVRAVGTAHIPAGHAAAFQIRLENPPADAVDLEAAFASPGEAARETAQAASPTAALEGPLVLGPEQDAAPAAPNRALSENGAPSGNAPVDGLAPRFADESAQTGPTGGV